MCDYDTIFDIYKNDKSSKEDKIKHMPQLVSHFYNYLNSINPDSIILSSNISIRYTKKLKFIIEKLENYINIIINFLKSIADYTVNYFDNYYLLLDLITISIIIIYKYINASKYIGGISQLKKFNINDIIKDLDITEYSLQRITKNLLDKVSDIPSNYYKYYYLAILKDLFFYDKYKFKDIEKYSNINKIIIFFQLLKYSDIKNIITIPQYEGICWFTAFINSICYSDANKKILSSLYDDNLKINNLNSPEYNPEKTYDYKQILIILVYYIINNCTECLKFDKDIFKNLPILFFKTIHKYIKNTTSENDYISEFFNKLKNKDITDDDINLYGLYNSAIKSYVYVDLYKFLNINSILLIFTNNKLYIDTNYKNETDESPHIILIESNVKYNVKKLQEFDKINNYKNDIEIQYKTETYILDYIIYISLCRTCSKSGHAISSITNNGKEYFHDTNKIIGYYYYYIACPFIRKNWKDDFKYKNIKKFSLSKCYHFNNNQTDMSKQLLRYTAAKNMEYSMEENNIACYVKKLSNIKVGGNNEKLISTNIKINIVINNKKIQRKIYINNDGIKVIKYNNKLIKIYYK